MISESYIKDLLLSMGYIKKNHIYEKFFPSVDCYIKVDLKNRTIIYPEDRGMTISNRTTCNFSAPENFVVLECVTRLFDKGYRPEHLNLEKEWTLGHESKGGRADICVSDQEGNTLFIVECKTYGREYEKEYKNIVNDGGQLFSYWQQERSCKFLVLYASKYEGKQIKWDTESIDCSDDANIVALSQKDDSIKLFKNAHTVSELYSVWDETYEKRFSGDVIFRDDSSAYQIGVKPLRKADLKDFADNNKIVNKFEEILRHNNVSDKENAFNRLVALFICKLVDEIQKDMEEIVDFQYKVGTDTYESLQDRLQRLHKEGMEKFMKEEIFYVPDDYAENLVRQYTGQERKNMIAHLKHDPGLTVYSLSDEKTFDITIGDRVLSEEIVSGGRVPVYSANVYEEFGRIDKENMKDYSRPSVIWGIDGDWMVNIIPAGVPFYPTDHCGVLRIKTEKILPEYMMYALQAEGEYERFSRNNRASAQRIRSLVVQAPETKIQKNIIDELKALDDKINGQNAEIEKYENSIRTKFDQIFHLEEFISDGVFSKYEGYSVEDLCIDGRGRVINQQYIENHKGPYPVYSSQTTNDGIFGSIDTFDFDGEYITWTTDGAKAGTVFYRNGKFNCTNVCGTLKAKNDKVNMRYLAYLLNRIAYKFVSRVGNNKLMNDAMKKIVVPVPTRQLQDEFADFVQSVEKSKFECIGKKEKFEIEKDAFVHKYFR